VNASALGAFFTGANIHTEQELRRAVDEARQEQAELLANYYETILGLNAQVTNLNGQISPLNTLILDLQGQIVSLTQGNANYSATIISLNQQISQLKEMIDEQKVQLQEVLIAHDEVVAGLNFVAHELQKEIYGLTTGNSIQASQIELLQQIVDGHLATINGHLTTIAQLNNLVEYLQKTIPDIEMRVDFVVMFYVNGNVWDMQIVSNGVVAVPAAPTGNWTFAGWSIDGDKVINPESIEISFDTEFHAVINCAVTFIVDGEVWDTRVARQNGFVALPTEPEGFAGWSLNGVDVVDVGALKIVENISFLALVVNFVSVSFAEDCWSLISQISEARVARRYYNIGDEKTIVLSTNEVINVRILGFEHDKKSDGSGKAGITLGTAQLLNTPRMIHGNDSNDNGWTGSHFRQSTAGAIFGQLPSQVQDIVKLVDKQTGSGSINGANTVREPFIDVSQDKIFLLSGSELFGNSAGGLAGEGEQYEFWRGKSAADRIKREFTTPRNWRLRSPSISNGRFLVVNTSGNVTTSISNNASVHVVIAFAV
jgi:hypothetical protein